MRNKRKTKTAFDPFGPGEHPVARVAFKDALGGGIQSIVEGDTLWIGLPLADLSRPCPVSTPRPDGKSSSFMLASSGSFKVVELENPPKCLGGRIVRVNAMAITSTRQQSDKETRLTKVTV